MRSFVGFLALLGGVEAVSDAPVTKVVELLKELKSKIVLDGEQEQKTYDKFACWCETTTQRKADMILQAKKDIQRLGTAVLKGKGKVATLAAEIAQLRKEIKENNEYRSKITAVRQKENADFSQEKAEMEQTLNALERAIGVLSGAGTQEKSVAEEDLEKNRFTMLQVKDTVRTAASVANLSRKDAALVQQFLGSEYNPQSATITGILKDMYNTFASTLEETTTQELTDNENYEKEMDLKLEALQIATEQKASKEAKKAETEAQLAEDNQALEDTTKEMNDNADFFDATKKSCHAKSEEWTVRKTMRSEELMGVEKAMEILSGDAARALFGKAIKPGQETISFLQTSPSANKDLAKQAYRSLQKSAAKTQSLRLASLAVTLRKAGHFVKVIKSIDDMVKTLQEEESDDKSKKDECNETMHTLNEKVALEKHEIMRNEKKIAKQTKKIEKLEKNIQKTAALIQETLDTLAQMKADREAEKLAYEEARRDDEAAIELLEKATKALASYFVKNGIDENMEKALIQEEPEFKVSEDQAPETEFSGHNDNQGQTKGIVSMLNMITNDLRNEVKQGIATEEASVKAYLEAKEQTEQYLESLREKKTNLEDAKNATEQARTAEENAMADNQGELAAAEEDIASKKEGCDWIASNFDKRAEMRAAEMQGLREAKSILSGMQATSLLSTRKSFDDQKLASIEFSHISA
jgi:hypothetical protein